MRRRGEPWTRFAEVQRQDGRIARRSQRDVAALRRHEGPIAVTAAAAATAQGEAAEQQPEGLVDKVHNRSPGSHVCSCPSQHAVDDDMLAVNHFKLSLRMRGVTKIKSSA